MTLKQGAASPGGSFNDAISCISLISVISNKAEPDGTGPFQGFRAQEVSGSKLRPGDVHLITAVVSVVAGTHG